MKKQSQSARDFDAEEELADKSKSIWGVDVKGGFVYPAGLSKFGQKSDLLTNMEKTK